MAAEQLAPVVQLEQQNSIQEGVIDGGLETCSRRTRSKKTTNTNCMTCNDKETIDDFRFNDNDMNNDGRHLSSGAYGDVERIDSKNGDIKVAVKTFKRSKDYKQEKEITKIINERFSTEGNYKYNLVPSYYSEDCDRIVMHLKHGTLDDLMNKSDLGIEEEEKKNLFKKIYQVVVSAMRKLQEKEGAYYTDLKPANILYEIKDDNKIHIYLADLGGIVFGDEIKDPTQPVFEDIDDEYGEDDENYDETIQQGVFTYPYHLHTRSSVYPGFRMGAISEIKNRQIEQKFLDNFIQQIVTFAIYCGYFDKPQFRNGWISLAYNSHPNNFNQAIMWANDLFEDNEILKRHMMQLGRMPVKQVQYLDGMRRKKVTLQWEPTEERQWDDNNIKTALRELETAFETEESSPITINTDRPASYSTISLTRNIFNALKLSSKKAMGRGVVSSVTTPVKKSIIDNPVPVREKKHLFGRKKKTKKRGKKGKRPSGKKQKGKKRASQRKRK